MRSGGITTVLAAAFAWLTLAAPAAAQDTAPAAPTPTPAGAPPRDFSTYRPSVVATRIATGEAPNIDGDISDPVWQKAPAIDQFYQLEPKEGQPGSERTVVHVLYDDDNLYFSIYAYDDPAQVTARVKARDGAIENDDVFRIYLDPSMTRRNGYAFEINPLGSRREGLIQNNAEFLYNWNTLWAVKTRFVSDGWTAEVRIPFRSISYDRARSDWGFDLFRLIRRKNERMRWSSVDIRIQSPDISRSGTLTGVTGISEGIGLDAQVYGLLRYTRDWDPGGDADGVIRPSGNIYYKVTPALTGMLTFNTDFSDTPLDARQINITRFGLFYPETRDFFLQDAAAFEFGGENLRNDPNGRPFFSRNIGLVNDSPVNLAAGAKLSGEYGGFNIGALAVRTGTGPDGTPGQTLEVARVTHPVFEESKVGFMFSNGDPTGLTHNTVAGGDFQYRNSHVFGSNTFQADAYYTRSMSSDLGDDDSFGLALNYPNEPWNGNFRFKQVGENFAPALGFVSRPGIREYAGNFMRKDRYSDSLIRFTELGVWADVYTGLDNRIQSRFEGAWVDAYLNSGDFGLFETWNDYEVVAEPFTLPHDVTVPAGTYQWQMYHLHFETAGSREIFVYEDVQCCGYFGGWLLQTDTTVHWNPNTTFNFTFRHIMDQIRLDTGHVTIHIGEFDADVNFTPDMQLRAQLQYDNISNGFGASLRYRWEYAPGSELLVTAGDIATILHGSYVSHVSQFGIRLGHLFRF